jgi:outer membrane protein assembly complex protein YaeT
MANALMPDSAYLDGVVSVNVEAARDGETWNLSGEGSVEDGELSVATPAFAVTDLSATLELDGGALRIEHLTGRAGGGSIAGSGAVSIPGGEQDSSALRFQLDAERVRLEYPEGMRSEFDSNLVLESREGRYLLSGRIDVQQAEYRRRISPERELLDALRRKTLSLKGEPGLTGAVDLDIAVSSRRAVVVDNNLGEMQWYANLLVRGTLAAPEASGNLNAAPGGTITFARNRYELESARILMESYPVEPAELDIQARTEVGDREITLSITGKTDNLRTSIASPTDPALTRGDATSLLLTGRTVEEVRGTEGDVLAQEAATYLGSGLLSMTESELTSALPVTTVRLEPGIVGSETDPGVRFSLGRAITEDLFLTYSIGLDDPEEQFWIIDYDLPRRLKLRAIREDGNEYTGGISQVALFDFYERNRPKRLEELPRGEILSMTIEGSVPLPAETVQDTLGIEVGDGYDYWEARDAAERLMEELRITGYLSARVSPVTEPEDAVQGEPVSLVFEVDTGPRVLLELRGTGLPADLEEWVRERFEGVIPARAQALRVARELTWELMSRDYYSAAVEADVDGTEEELRATFDVTLGAKGGSDVDVLIEGNDNLSDEAIERLLPPKESPRFFELVLGRPEELKEEVRLLYSAEGYLEAEVLELSTRVDPQNAELHVILVVEEGERFDVGDVIFSGANRLPEPQLLSEVELRTGASFRFLAHLADRQRIASLYRREGFPDARVQSDLAQGERRVDVTFVVEEGEPARVGEIQIVGARVTREGVIRGALTFESGGTLRVSDLTETQRRLYNLRVFRSVDVRAEPTEDPFVRNVVVEVTELPDLRVGYGVRYSTDDQLEVSGDAQFVNIFGTARQLGFHAFANRRMTEVRATLAIPSFFGREVGSDFFLSRETEEGEGFESEAWSATFQQGRRIFSGVLAQWSFTHRQAVVRETITSGPFPFDVQADRSVLAFSLIEDTRSSIVKPRAGRFWNATLSFAPQFLGSDLRFLKLYGQFFYYRSLSESVVWASTYRAGIGTGFGQYLLPTDRFRAGGPSSVRGFPVNELGPPDPITGTVIGGEGVVVMNQELRFPLFWRFGGIAFYDAGNVFLQARDFNPLDLRHTSGLGLTMDLPFGLVSVDWAYLLNPPANLPRTRWHFTFGYSF